MEALTEEKRLVRQAKSGSAEAFVQLYDAFVERVYRYVYFWASDEMAAESITSRVFIQAWNRIHRYRGFVSPFAVWLYKIAKDQVAEHYRIHPKIVMPDDGFVLAVEGSVLVEARDVFGVRAMRDAMQFLTEDQQQVLILKFIAGMSVRNIARIMIKSEDAIRGLEMDALQALAKIQAGKAENKTDFQQILEECLIRLSNGTASVDECLARYPEYAAQLRPFLRTVFFLNLGRNVMPTPAFKAHAHVNLTQYLRFHQRPPRKVPLFRQAALTLSVMAAVFLVFSTAQAQSALPGDNFYAWKRTSEEVWRVLSPDPVATDIALANRRIDEWVAVANDPVLSASAMDGYFDVLSRLKTTADPQALGLIMPVLLSHQRILNDAGLSASEFNDHLNVEISSFPIAAVTQAAPTSAPEIIPTPPHEVKPPTHVPTEIVPTVVPTKIVPTVAPTIVPTSIPTTIPTAIPTLVPTSIPTAIPTTVPTLVPTSIPTAIPTTVPTTVPTSIPTTVPTIAPTIVPTTIPTDEPTAVPTVIAPTSIPTDVVEPSPTSGVP
ncbi:MAG: sigma-70 family RNA polymerase sigma factor [Chloroflexi bacterium]|nr:sigma-70 family RNA polymerase sigma factor [Chloroflexota bacterium]